VKFLLVDATTAVGQAAQFGGPASPEQRAAIAAALNVQMNRDVATWWGGSFSVRAGAATDLQPGDVACVLLDAMPNAPGDVAYHDVDGNEVPVVFLARTQCSSLTSGPDSVSSALSHELCEAAGDPFCNAWRDRGDGSEAAQELCDAVQEAGYTIDGISVSDFLLPAFFAKGAPPPYDYLGTVGVGAVDAPVATMPGGAQLVRSGADGATSVLGLLAARRAARKAHWSSRTFRRGARI
jgi:hypothetical protein